MRRDECFKWATIGMIAGSIIAPIIVFLGYGILLPFISVSILIYVLFSMLRKFLAQ